MPNHYSLEFMLTMAIQSEQTVGVKMSSIEPLLDEDIIKACESAVRNAKSDRYARLAYNALLSYSYSETSILRALSKQHQIVWC